VADVQSNIEVNLDASQALGQLKALQRQLATFHSSVATTSSAAAKAQANLQSNLINSVNATGKFAAGLTTIKSSADSFTDSLERNKFSTREYFRYAGGATKTFGRLFKQEYDTIGKVSEERLKTMQTQYIKMGRTANGAIQSIAIRPLALDMDHLATRTAIASQKQQLFGQLLKQGSTNLLNFGKNTQWAGRQLMVGFTVPLTMLGATAGKTFMELEKQAVRFKRVYGEMFTTSGETEKAFKEIELLAKSFTKYGVAVEKTMEMAADAAASGKMGAELMAQVAEATRLAVLGGVEQAEALKTTISLTNAFGIEADKLKQKIDFLNAVENQTVLNIEDLTIAVPKAGPVVRQLGGDVEDLAFFMTAMKEGGINASEGANALKSGLASLINPSKKAAAFLLDLGVNINGIVESNKGNIKDTVIQFAQALDTLAPLERSRAIEQLFGKFQFSRLSTLFQNVTQSGTQASKTLSLAGASIEELAILSERELAKVENATGTKFKKSLENLKVSLAPVGEQFLKAITPIVEFIGRILEKFNGLGEGSKKAIVMLVGAVGLVGPALLMTFGLIANGAANIIKLFLTLRNGFLGLGKESNFLGNQTRYMSSEQIEAAAVATALNQSHSRLIQTFTAEAASANALATAYQRATLAGANFARINPGMMKPSFKPGAPKKFGDGGWVPGTGDKDTVPAVLTPGEFVVTKDAAQENKGFLQRLNKGGFVLRGDGTGGNPYAGEVKSGTRYDPTLPKFRVGSIEYAKALVAKQKEQAEKKKLFLGMPNSYKDVQGIRNQDAVLDLIDDEIKNSNLNKLRPKNFGKLIAESSGRSFPVSGIGGIYEKPDGSKVFVKPVLDEKSALAEIRGTTIARDVHGLVSPEQKLSTMIDPNNSKRRLIVLESKFDPRFAAMSGEFTKSDFIKQAVASVVRGDKDLSKSNLSGNVLADVGPAGVFGAASGKRNFGGMLPVKDQAMVNFLGVKGGAKRYFADATRSIAQSMTPAQYEKAMIQELDRVLPKLKSSIGSFNLNPEEKVAYAQMVQRVEDAKKINWKEIHKVHAEGKTQDIKKPTTKPIQRPGEKGHRVSIKDPSFRKLLVARGFKLRGKPVKDLSILKPGGVAGTVELHYGDALSGPQPTHVGGRLDGIRKNAGYTMLGDQGYNQLTIGSKKLGLPEPYPLTFSDAKKSEKILQDSLNNPIGKTSQSQIRMRTIALTQLQEDMKTIGERGWKNAMAQRTAVAAAYSENEKYPPAGKTYKAIYKAFQSSPGIDTQSLRNAYLKKVDSLWESGALSDINRRNRGKISGKGTQHSGLGINKKGQPPVSLASMMQDTMAATKNNKTFTAFRSLLNIKSGGIDPSGVTAQALALKGFKFAIRRNNGGSVPGYGEKDTVPALLTPGEFVVNKAATQEHGPILQAMNAGKVEYKATGTTRSQTKQQRKVKIQEEVNRREYQAQLKIRADERRAEKQRLADESKFFKIGKSSEDAQTAGAKQANQQKIMQRSSMLMTSTYAASGALSMMGNDIAQKLQPALGALTAATMAMSLIQGPKSALAVGVVALAGTYYLLKKQNEALLKKTIETTVNMGAGAKSMKELAETTGKVSAREIMDRRRNEKLSQFQIQTGKKTFGQSFVEGEKGQQMVKDFGQRIKDGGPGGQQLAQSELTAQLATAISSGIMTPEQARSVAANIGEAMGDRALGITVNGKLINLFGSKGENLIKDPLTIKTQLIQDSKTRMNIASNAANASGTFKNKDLPIAAGAGLAGAGAGAIAGAGTMSLIGLGFGSAGAAAAGAGIGAGVGSAVVPIIGTAIGALVGIGIGAMVGIKQRNDRIAKATGASVAMQKIALEQGQELLDSYDLENQKKIQLLESEGKLLEADKARLEYETGRIKLLATNASLNTEIMNSYKKASGGKVQDLLLKGSVSAAKEKYKGTALAPVADEAVKQITGLGLNKEQEYLINMQISSGQMDPMQALNFVDMFTGDKKGAQKFMDITTRFGAVVANESMAVASMFTEKGTGKPLDAIQKQLVLNVAEAKTPDEAQKLIDFYAMLGKTGTVVDLEIVGNYLEKNPKKAINLQKTIAQIQNQKGKINMKVTTELLGANSETLKALNTDLEFYNKLPDEQKKVYLTALVTTTETIDVTGQDFNNFMAEKGMTTDKNKVGTLRGDAKDKKFDPKGYIRNIKLVTKAEAQAQYATFKAQQLVDTGSVDNTKPFKPGAGEDGSGQRSTILDDLLKRLKLVQDGSINATEGLKELKRVMSGKNAISLTKFQGIDQQLLKDGKVSKEFLDFVDSLGPEGLQTDLEVFIEKGANGLKVLNENGKALMRGMVAAKLGEYQENIMRSNVEIKNQVGAMSVLRGAGFSYAEAMELASDQTIALAIANKELSPAQLKELLTQTKELTAAQKQYDNAQKIALMDEMDGQVARFNIVEKFVALQEKLIENQYVLEQSQLEKKQNDNNYNLDLISRQEDKINETYDKQISALEEINALAEKNNQLISTKMSIADALAKGDISAASSAMQEYRNAKIQQVAKTRMEALQKAKTNALESVTSPNGLTRVQIEKDNKIIADRLSDITNNIRLAKDKLDITLKDTLGLTRVEIAAAGSAIKLALEAGIDPNDSKFLGKILQGVKGDAESTILALTGVTKSIKEANDEMIAAKAKLAAEEQKRYADQIEKEKADKAAAAAAYEASKAAAAQNVKNVSISNAVNDGTPGVLAGINQDAETKATEKFLADEKFRQDAINKTQGFVPRKSQEDREAQLAKDAEIVNNAYKIALATPKVAPKTSSYNPLNYLRLPMNSGGMVPKYMAMGGMVRMPYAEPAPAQKMNMGGMVRKYMASGGLARGTDTVPAMLTPGEYVINKDATQKFGPLLSAINSPTFRTPESMSSIKNLGGSQTEVNNSKTLYNYNLSVNVSNSNANPNDIARTVINQIKMIENQRIRGY
jgi:TP901 family phage tail tape measure protein